MSRNLIIFAGVTSLFQAVVQLMFASLCIAQYFCVADFLREVPSLIFIKIVYFMNPSRCGNTVNIGQALDGIANQAFVLMESEPFTTTRTFIINCTSLGISFLWIVASCILLVQAKLEHALQVSVMFSAGGARKAYTRRVQWPWITTMVGVCAVDVVATVCYANDTFHTRTLRDVMKYIGGTVSGTGATPIDTSAASLIMVALYSKFVVFFILNAILIVLVALNENGEIKEVEAPITESSLRPEMPAPVQLIATQSQTTPRPSGTYTIAEGTEAHIVSIPPPVQLFASSMQKDDRVEAPVTESSLPPETMARPSGTYTIAEGKKKTQTILATEAPIVPVPPPVQPLDSSVQKDDTSSITQLTAPSAVYFNREKLRAWHNIPRVYFNRAYRGMKKNLFNKESSTKSKGNSLLEIAEHLIESRRDTAAKRQRKMPNAYNAWAYIPAEGEYHMRDNLPSDEDLPPIPLPDYCAVPHSYRKASVHRTPSNLATQRRAHFSYLSRKPPHEKLDVLY